MATRVRRGVRAVAGAHSASRCCPRRLGAAAKAAFDGAGEAGVNAGALAAARVVAPHAEELPHAG